jgi:Dyp-type peroxidase family
VALGAVLLGQQLAALAAESSAGGDANSRRRGWCKRGAGDRRRRPGAATEAGARSSTGRRVPASAATVVRAYVQLRIAGRSLSYGLYIALDDERRKSTMARDVSTEPLFPTDKIQGDILVGLLKKVEKFVFFTIGSGEEDKAAFRAFLSTLEITSMQECLDQRAAVAASKAAGHGEALLPTPGLNIAFTRAGLSCLGVEQLDDASEFNAGMSGSQNVLADPDPQDWSILGPKEPVHGVFLVTGGTESEVDNVIALRLAPAGANGWTEVRTEVGVVRPEPAKGHEHFGYADGVSQPAVRGQIAPGVPLDPTTGPDPDQADPGRDLLWPGEFVFGFPGQDGKAAELIEEGEQPKPTGSFTDNGAFLVFRRLAQKVPEFDLSVKAAAATVRATITTADGTPSAEPSADFQGAQLVGRWKSGAPLINAPHADDLSVADGTVGALAFEFDGDRDGLVCPWAAHVRKAYPRDDVLGNIGPTREEVDRAEAGTQTHRMMRRGIAFGPELTAAEALSGTTTEERGLLFACYVTSLFDQFEFVQKFWVNNENFVQPNAGVDAIIGQSLAVDQSLPFTAGMPFDGTTGEKPQLALNRFVHMEGGEYFFAPSIPTIRDTLAK